MYTTNKKKIKIETQKAAYLDKVHAECKGSRKMAQSTESARGPELRSPAPMKESLGIVAFMCNLTQAELSGLVAKPAGEHWVQRESLPVPKEKLESDWGRHLM